MARTPVDPTLDHPSSSLSLWRLGRGWDAWADAASEARPANPLSLLSPLSQGVVPRAIPISLSRTR